MLMFKGVFLALLSLLLINCAKSNNNSYAGPAPTQESQLGFIVKSSDNQLASLQNIHPKMTIRALSSKQGLYELSNVSEVELKRAYPNLPLEKNKFVSMSPKKAKTNTPFKVANTSKDALAAAKSCRLGPFKPKIKITGSVTPRKNTITLGKSVSLSAIAEAHPRIGGNVRIIWDLKVPQFSKNKFKKGITNSQAFTPDSVGEYSVTILLQNKDLTCFKIPISILVTANPKLRNVPMPQREIKHSFFTHLTQTNSIEAWKHSKGRGVVVAVLDTGLNYNHAAINSNLKVNTAELTKGKDSDSNGLPNDFLGWDFVNGDNLPFDDNGHGTHVSGLVASPVTGVAPEAKILPVKVMDAAGRSDLGTVIKGMYYAIEKDVDVINISMQIPTQGIPPVLQRLFALAAKKNITVVTASGNGDRKGKAIDLEKTFVLPASVKAENNLVVTSTAQEKLTSYGNFGKTTVHVGAPGGNSSEPIFSLAPMNASKNPFVAHVGTSMAAPITAGVVALVLSMAPELTPLDVKNLIMSTGKDLPSLKGKTVSGRQVNALAAVEALLPVLP